MNSGREFARHACSPDRTVAIDESQAGPHRGASRAQGLTDRLRFVCHRIGKLRPWIYAEVKPLRIERFRFKQFLRKIVARDSTVRRNAEICGEQAAKRDPGGRPRSRIGTALEKFQTNPNRSQSNNNPSDRKSVLASCMEDQCCGAYQDDKSKRRCSWGR